MEEHSLTESDLAPFEEAKVKYMPYFAASAATTIAIGSAVQWMSWRKASIQKSISQKIAAGAGWSSLVVFLNFMAFEVVSLSKWENEVLQGYPLSDRNAVLAERAERFNRPYPLAAPNAQQALPAPQAPTSWNPPQQLPRAEPILNPSPNTTVPSQPSPQRPWGTPRGGTPPVQPYSTQPYSSPPSPYSPQQTYQPAYQPNYPPQSYQQPGFPQNSFPQQQAPFPQPQYGQQPSYAPYQPPQSQQYQPYPGQQFQPRPPFPSQPQTAQSFPQQQQGFGPANYSRPPTGFPAQNNYQAQPQPYAQPYGYPSYSPSPQSFPNYGPGNYANSSQDQQQSATVNEPILANPISSEGEATVSDNSSNSNE